MSNDSDRVGHTGVTPGKPALDVSANIRSVTDECKAAFPMHQFACNDFVTTVSSAFGISLTGIADDIVAAIQASPWNYLGNDMAAAAQAAAFAGQDNCLVIAGLTAAELQQAHGHVVVITPGELVKGLFPHLYCGSTIPSIRLQDSSINYAFVKSKRDIVHYSWIGF
ncbi:MAG TPA: hypothetical protein VMB19_00385 [Silvibacterium sp.]|nr:hypothetical protein [Silvibacterium sp.]